MSKNKWYEASFRRNLVDMHIDDWNEEFFSEFDPLQYLDCLKRGHIQSPMIYLQSHVGLCNWPTKSGKMHAGFQGENKVGKLIDLCHKEKMDVIGYYSLIFNNWAYDRFPAWRMVDINGNPSRHPDAQGIVCGGRYGILCPNNMEYRQFIATQLKELLGTYKLEGVFLDMAFWPMVCHCDACKKRYFEETGLDIPETVDWNDPLWVQYQQKREEWMGEFAMFCSNTIKELVPGMPVEHNFANGTNSWQFGVNEGVSNASDYTGGDLYGGHYHESFICKLYYEITKNQPFEYMTSRCDLGLSDHTTTKSPDSLRLHNYLTLSHHGAMLFIDAIDPKGTLNPKAYDAIGEAFQESMPYEKYLKGKMVSDIAIYYNMESKMDCGSPVKKDQYTYPEIDSDIGAAISLSNHNYLYTVIPNCKKEKIMEKKVVILSDAPFLSKEEIETFKSYVKSGGAMFISGDTNKELIKELLGLEFAGYTKEKITYIAPTAQGQAYFGEMYSENHPIAYNGKQMLVKNPENKTVLATITLPYTDPEDKTRFASIHSNPPGKKTEIPSIISGGYGKGKIIWSAASFAVNPQQAHKNVFIRLLQSLYGGCSVLSSNAPYFVQFTVFDDEENRELYFHAVNVQQQDPLIRIGDFDVSLRTEKSVRAAYLLPDEKELEYQYEDGVLSFKVTDFDIFKMYKFQY